MTVRDEGCGWGALGMSGEEDWLIWSEQVDHVAVSEPLLEVAKGVNIE